jgi:hypothetical protein
LREATRDSVKAALERALAVAIGRERIGDALHAGTRAGERRHDDAVLNGDRTEHIILAISNKNGRKWTIAAGSTHTLVEEREHQRGDFVDLLVEREMTGIKAVDLGIGHVAPEGLATGSDEGRVIAAPFH